MNGAAAPGAPVTVVVLTVLALGAAAVTTTGWPATLTAVGCVVLAATGRANPALVGALLLAYLLAANSGGPPLRAHRPVLVGALAAVLVVIGVDLVAIRPAVWLVLAACAALPAAVAMAAGPAAPTTEQDPTRPRPGGNQ